MVASVTKFHSIKSHEGTVKGEEVEFYSVTALELEGVSLHSVDGSCSSCVEHKIIL